VSAPSETGAATAVVVTRRIGGEATSWKIEDADGKLRWRAALPGASVFDRAAQALRERAAQGADPLDLLPLALPATWMVNAKATSRAMQHWLSPEVEPAWAALLETLAFDLAPEAWLALAPGSKELAGRAVEALATGVEGATLCAVTKVLALLRPQLVPLMDDAALWFALELVAEPKTADAPSAPPSAFVPMMDWFAGEVVANEAALIALAAEHDRAVLDATQTLDRLLWMESWGQRLSQGARGTARAQPPSGGGGAP